MEGFLTKFKCRTDRDLVYVATHVMYTNLKVVNEALAPKETRFAIWSKQP